MKKGSNPIKFSSNGCSPERDNEDISVEVLHLLSSEFGVVPLGRARSLAASSCEQVAAASAQNTSGFYWITDGTTTQQEYCNF